MTAPRRRWSRFSLRTLLLLIVVVGLPLGWLGQMLEGARRQYIAVRELQRNEFEVVFESDDTRPPTIQKWLRKKLLGDDFVKDAVLVKCHPLFFTDAELTDLKNLPELRELDLADVPVTDAGLVHLAGLSNLTWLNLDRTPIGDAGLMHLAGMVQLEYLHLKETDVTDAGLQHLQRLGRLAALNLSGTQVTDVGVRQLEKALPRCSIKH